MSAKELGEQIRSLPPLFFWPTDEEDHALPEVEIDEQSLLEKFSQIQLKNIGQYALPHWLRKFEILES